MLRPSDLSLESVVSLADLPISGFPKSPEAGSDPRLEGLKGRENAGMTARTEDGGDGGVVEAAEEGMVEFADTEAGACVFECSSSSETSGGILQVRLFFISFVSGVLSQSFEGVYYCICVRVDCSMPGIGYVMVLCAGRS